MKSINLSLVFSLLFVLSGCMTVEDARQQGASSLDTFLGVKLGVPFSESMNEVITWTKNDSKKIIRYEPKVKFSDDYVFYAYIVGEKQIVYRVGAIYDLEKNPPPNYATMREQEAVWAQFHYDQKRKNRCYHIKDVLSGKYQKPWLNNKLYFKDRREIFIDNFAEVIEAKDVMLQAEFDAEKKRAEFDGL